MSWVDTIFSLIWDISDWFDNLYETAKDWVWPFRLVAPLFLTISDTFWDLLAPIADFGDWVDDVWTKTQQILTSEGILGLIKGWFPTLETIVTWYSTWWDWVTLAITSWWSTTFTTVQGWIAVALQTATDLITATSTTVQGWIAVALQTATNLITDVSLSLATLQTAWDDFKDKIPSMDALLLWFTDWWTAILTPLSAWWADRLLEVDALTKSTISVYFPFYDALVALWASIAEFFTNPFTWLTARLESWFWESE